MFTKSYHPTLTHVFIKLLDDKGLLKWWITQNVDGLERKVGIPPAKLIEVHGTFATGLSSSFLI